MPLNRTSKSRRAGTHRAEDPGEPAAPDRKSPFSWIHLEALLIGGVMLLGAASMVAGWLE